MQASRRFCCGRFSEQASSVSHNPFMVQEPIAKVGDVVTATWRCDKRNGGGTNVKTGPVSEIDDWIRIEGTGSSPGYLHVPISYLLRTGSIVKAQPNNPFLVA